EDAEADRPGAPVFRGEDQRKKLRLVADLRDRDGGDRNEQSLHECLRDRGTTDAMARAGVPRSGCRLREPKVLPDGTDPAARAMACPPSVLTRAPRHLASGRLLPDGAARL